MMPEKSTSPGVSRVDVTSDTQANHSVQKAPTSSGKAVETKSKDGEDDPFAIIRGKTVLVTEDNAQIRMLLSQRLRHLGANVTIAENGREAWDSLFCETAPRPDIILMDMMMPEMDGVELLGRIRKSEALKHIPVMVMSARRDRKLVILLMKMGIQEYVVKPLKVADTLARIAEILQESSAPQTDA